MKEKNTQALTVYDNVQDPMQAIKELGKWLTDSKMFGVTNQAQGNVLAMACFHERKSPMEISARYHIIENKLSMRADAMQAEFQNIGGSVSWIQSDADICTVKVSHPQLCPDGLMVTKELKVLKERGLTQGQNGTKKNWKRSPENMLRARAISDAVRMVAPAIVVGRYTPEEISDIEPEKVSTTVIDDTSLDATPEPEPSMMQVSQRAQNVINSFKSFGVVTDDLERLVETPATHWMDDEYSKFTSVRDSILKAEPEERGEVIKAIFELEPGAMG